MSETKCAEGFAHHFSINNLPWGVASSTQYVNGAICTRLGDRVVFVNELGLEVSGKMQDALKQTTLNQLAAIDKGELKKLRLAMQEKLRANPNFGNDLGSVRMRLPFDIKDFSDFSCSREHVLNAGEVVMGVRELPPMMHRFPIGYCGRASSIVASGATIHRPWGQYRGDKGAIVFGPTKQLDYELEVGCFVSKPSRHGDRVALEDADDHIFGLVLLNDLSARDHQSAEMKPLGPMNGKSFGTTISPWVVTLEALEPFAAAAPAKAEPPPPYLEEKKEKALYDITLTAELFEGGPEGPKTTMCSSKLETMYWTFRDLVAHQTINGCGINAGDLLGTGTVSGEGEGEHACLLETTMGGRTGWKTSSGKDRVWIEDGDGVRLSAFAGEGVGFGECDSWIAPAKDFNL